MHNQCGILPHPSEVHRAGVERGHPSPEDRCLVMVDPGLTCEETVPSNLDSQGGIKNTTCLPVMRSVECLYLDL